MRYWLRCMLSGTLLILWSVTSVLILPAQAREQGEGDLIRELEAARLAKSVEDILVFSVGVKKGMGLRKGRLSDETSILDEESDPLDAKALEIGSVWTIKLLYPYDDRGLPVILEMRRIRGPRPH